jgi:hypothetical protein
VALDAQADGRQGWKREAIVKKSREMIQALMKEGIIAPAPAE